MCFKFIVRSVVVSFLLLHATQIFGAEVPPAKIIASPNLEALAVLRIDVDSVTCEEMENDAYTALRPPPPPSGSNSASTTYSRKDSVQVCPYGFVPKYRNSSSEEGDEIGTLSVCATEKTYYAGAIQQKTLTTGYGVVATLSIHNPSMNSTCDMSTGQISVVKGDDNDSVVETGMRKFWDSYPKLMIGHWRNRAFEDDAGFVYTHPTYSNNMSLSAYVGSNRQFSIHYNSSQGNWWVWFNNGWVGYFPGSRWNGSFTRADAHHWYGEVIDADGVPPPITDMGSGYHASSSQAAKMYAMWTLDNTGVWGIHSTDYSKSPPNPYYTIEFTSDNSFRYGGPGN